MAEERVAREFVTAAEARGACMRKCMHAYASACVQTCMRADMRVCVYMRACSDTRGDCACALRRIVLC